MVKIIVLGARGHEEFTGLSVAEAKKILKDSRYAHHALVDWVNQLILPANEIEELLNTNPKAVIALVPMIAGGSGEKHKHEWIPTHAGILGYGYPRFIVAYGCEVEGCDAGNMETVELQEL